MIGIGLRFELYQNGVNNLVSCGNDSIWLHLIQIWVYGERLKSPVTTDKSSKKNAGLTKLLALSL